MSEISTYEYLVNVLHELAGNAAMGSAYSKSWGDDFRCKEIDEVWYDKAAPMRNARNRRITIDNLAHLTEEQKHALRIMPYNDKIHLIPLWMWNYILDGEILISIRGEVVTKGVDDIDLDVRGGCIAYGFVSSPSDPILLRLTNE